MPFFVKLKMFRIFPIYLTKMEPFNLNILNPMKNTFWILIFIFAGYGLQAQTPSATAVRPAGTTVNKQSPVLRNYFCCTSCDYTAKVMRSCPVHKLALVRVGDWYCPTDGKIHQANGKCSVHKRNLVQMEMKYQQVTPKPDDMKASEPVR